VESISSRYEKLTGRSPSADLLASSLDDLLKSLKTKFNKSKAGAGGDGNEQESTNPIDTIWKLIASSTAGKINNSPLRRMQMAVMDENEGEEDQVRIVGGGPNTKQKSE
jgi:hypothetical protein